MSDLLLYLIKANVALALFYLGYYLLLRKLTFYGINRYYLVFALVFSALYPAIPIDQWFAANQDAPPQLLLTLSDWQQLQLPEERNMLASILSSAYWISICLFGLLFLVKLMGIGRIHFRSVPARWEHFDYRKSNENISPFSFWTNIYFNPLLYTEDEYEKIFSHEQVHVRQLHSLDILMAEMSLIFFWYNPFCWMIRKAIQENIEFITDQRVLSSGIDKKSYQYSLIQISTLSPPSYLGNHFNFKNLKKRIVMMNKKQSSKMQLGKYVFIIPAIVLGTLVFGVSKAYEQEGIQEKFQQNIKTNADLPEPAAGMEEKEAVVVQSSQSDGHKAAVVTNDTFPLEIQPLVIVDGSIAPNDALSKLNSADIHSIAVIKDASAMNIYGSKAENGVIKVTTKNGNAQTVNPSAFQDTLKSNDPLYIVDGEKQHSMEEVNAETIESIDVIKGDGATKQYGEEGKHGVILVTTKKGAKEPVVEESPDSGNKISAKISTDSLQLTGNLENHHEDKEPVVMGIKHNKTTSLEGVGENVLVFIDGKRISSGALDQIDPNNIQSLSVFKGESAIERYGEAGRDGVIDIISKGKN